MHRRLRVALTLITAVVAAALLAAGCGGELSKSEYQSKVQKIGKGVQKDMETFTNTDKPSEKDLEKAEESIDDAASELDDLNPPSDVAKLHDQLVSVLEDTADLFGEMGPLLATAASDPSKLSQGDLSKLTKVSGKFTKIQSRMEKIQKGFADKGYSNLGLEG